MTDPLVRLEVVDYDDEWPMTFRAEAARLRQALGSNVVRIEHNGSTAVPGLAAKPTIDILVSVPDLAAFEAYAEPLTTLGYDYRPASEQVAGPDQRFFRFPRSRPFHIHVCEAGGAFEREHLIFRDFLRAHPEVAAQYGRLKRELAAAIGHDRPRYLLSKAPFIESVLRRALAWSEETLWELPEPRA